MSGLLVGRTGCVRITGCIGPKVFRATCVDSPLISVSRHALNMAWTKKRLAKNTDIGAQRDVWCDTCKFIYEQPLRYIVI